MEASQNLKNRAVDSSKPTVLVVDDHGDTRRIVKWMLERWGYRAVEANDGGQAVEAAMREHPRVILMDLTMPHVDGFEAIRQIRGSSELREVPIIAMTAYDMALSRDKADAAGADYYLSKPVDFRRLEVLIEKILAARV